MNNRQLKIPKEQSLIKRIIKAIFYPPCCFICEQPIDHSLICQDCYQSLPFNHPCCDICATPFSENQQTCGECINEPKIWEKAWIPFIYKPPIDYFIKQMKFNANFTYLELLSVLFYLTYHQSKNKPEVIIPVPLHSSRLSQRGYNQSLELAKIISHLLDIPIDNHFIMRIKATTAQSNLKQKVRLINLKNSFKINPKHQKKYQHVIILDDVVTTGTTMTEIIKVIKKQGVQRCDIWAIAKVVI